MYKAAACNFKALSIALGLIFYGPVLNAQPGQSEGDKSQVNPQAIIKTPLSQGEAQQQLEVEQQRKLAEEEVRKSVILDALAVINETKNAVELIGNEKNNEALAALERATGKIEILLSRYRDTALLPIDFAINVTDTAPLSLEVIKKIGHAAERAIKDKDYPDARLLLNALRSEISVETYCLPLASYPAALKRAANLLERKASQKSMAVLRRALTSLIVVNQTLPIPVINAKVLLEIAEEKYKDNKDSASKLIKGARYELERARSLGYINKEDDEYQDVNEAIQDLQKQMDGNSDNSSLFHSLKNRLESFLKRHFDKKKAPIEPQNNDSQDSETPNN